MKLYKIEVRLTVSAENEQRGLENAAAIVQCWRDGDNHVTGAGYEHGDVTVREVTQ